MRIRIRVKEANKDKAIISREEIICDNFEINERGNVFTFFDSDGRIEYVRKYSQNVNVELDRDVYA